MMHTSMMEVNRSGRTGLKTNPTMDDRDPREESAARVQGTLSLEAGMGRLTPGKPLEQERIKEKRASTRNNLEYLHVQMTDMNVRSN